MKQCYEQIQLAIKKQKEGTRKKQLKTVECMKHHFIMVSNV